MAALCEHHLAYAGLCADMGLGQPSPVQLYSFLWGLSFPTWLTAV